MNNKLIIGAVLAVVVILGAVLLLGNKNQADKSMMEKLPKTSTTNELAQTATVNATADGFSPQTLTIKAGTRVTWVNKSGNVVNLASDPHPTHTAYRPLNLGEFGEGSSVQLVFDKAGTYKYHNHLNPSQTGTVVVQ